MKDTDIWEIKQIIQQGLEDSNLHLNVPSKETKIRLESLEISQKDISKQVGKMAVDVAEIKIHTTHIKELFDRLPCKDEEKRINELEKEVDQLVGKSIIAGSVFGFIGASFLAAIGWFFKK